jgi:hypothetical protein
MFDISKFPQFKAETMASLAKLEAIYLSESLGDDLKKELFAKILGGSN